MNKELKLSERQIKLLDGIEIYANENGEVVAWEANRESDYTEAGLKRTITILQDKGLIKIVSGSKTRAWTLVIALTDEGKKAIGADEQLNVYKVEFEDENFEIISARNEMEARWSAETYQEEHGYIMEIHQVDENYEPINSEEEELLFDVDSENIEDIWNMEIELDLGEEQELINKGEETAALDDILNTWKTYKAEYEDKESEIIVMDSLEGATRVADSLIPQHGDLLKLVELNPNYNIDEELKHHLVSGYKVDRDDFKLERKRNKIWNELLDEVFCTTDEEGNRPCDNGCICDKCQASWFLEEYEKAVNKAL